MFRELVGRTEERKRKNCADLYSHRSLDTVRIGRPVNYRASSHDVDEMKLSIVVTEVSFVYL